MILVPLNQIPSQTLTTILSGQTCQINVYQKFYGVFVDLYVGTTLIIGGVIAEDRNRIVRDVYLGFSGDIFFVDTQGNDDPDYTGLGTRWRLVYATAAELASIGLTG